jgi:hypothetical protein
MQEDVRLPLQVNEHLLAGDSGGKKKIIIIT